MPQTSISPKGVMLIVSVILTYFAIAALLLLVFRGLTLRNRMVDRMLGTTLKVRRTLRRRSERLTSGEAREEGHFIESR